MGRKGLSRAMADVLEDALDIEPNDKSARMLLKRSIKKL